MYDFPEILCLNTEITIFPGNKRKVILSLQEETEEYKQARYTPRSYFLGNYTKFTEEAIHIGSVINVQRASMYDA